MTAPPEIEIEDLRRVVVEGLQRAVDGLVGGYAAPLRRQLRAEDDAYEAAVLCLGFGRIFGGETKTLPCALTLGLLEEMGRIFLGLEGGPSVVDAWGMPRTLNAADGLHALGRQILLSDEALDPESRLSALADYATAARGFAEALHAWAPEGEGALRKAGRSLYSASAAFASLCCDLGDEDRTALEAMAESGSIATALATASKLPLHES